MSDKHTPKPERIDDAQVCVVWHPSDRAPAPELLKALSNKGMTLIDADDPHLAFSAACKVANTARRVVLVLDGRESLPNVDAIVGALPRFSPRVLCWAHVPGANPPLVPLVQPPKAAGPKPGLPIQPAKAPSPPAAASCDESKLRLVRDAEPAASKPRQPLSARDVLDADELDALLAGEAGDRKN